jgi:hypothetical protein
VQLELVEPLVGARLAAATVHKRRQGHNPPEKPLAPAVRRQVGGDPVLQRLHRPHPHPLAHRPQAKERLLYQLMDLVAIPQRAVDDVAHRYTGLSSRAYSSSSAVRVQQEPLT